MTKSCGSSGFAATLAPCYLLISRFMQRAYQGIAPRIHSSCYIDDSAQIVGDVEIGENSSVWMNAVIRGDVSRAWADKHHHTWYQQLLRDSAARK